MKAAFCAAAALAGILAGDARADGLPVVDVDVGATGVTAPRTEHRFVALSAGGDTLVARIDRGRGIVSGSRLLRGRLTIPAVAYDGSAAGLSADAASLVLIAPRRSFPRQATTFAVLDTRTLRIRTKVTLRGDFSFDAVSPDGRWLYVIEYTSSDDPRRYRVRALDPRSGKLAPAPIVDPREPGEAMTGFPLTRIQSADGRWAYTLYAGADHPFVHALDTAGRTARCIDLDWLHGRKDLWRMRFSLARDGRELAVRSGETPLAVVDTTGFTARPPGADEDGRESWRTAGLALAVLLAAVALYAARARRANPRAASAGP